MQGTTPALQCSLEFDIRISVQPAQLGTRAVEHNGFSETHSRKEIKARSAFANILLFKIPPI